MVEVVFTPQHPENIPDVIKRQEYIGDRHARIGIPFSVIQRSVTVLKREIYRIIIRTKADSEALTNLIVLAEELIDTHLNVMNQAFVNDIVKDARENQSLKLQALGIELALQTESLRASLYDCHRTLLRLVLQKNASDEHIPKIAKTHFGLWVSHKGELLFPETKEISILQKSISKISDLAYKVQDYRDSGNLEAVYNQLNFIDDQVTLATEVLSTITERTMAMESGKDQLTQLFNRRYLRTVLQREVRLSNNTGESFAVFIVDIDNFKLINDQYGHDAGDIALKTASEAILSSVRAGDFVFRYGGEEFLVVVAAVSKEDLETIANKIMMTFRGMSVQLSEQDTIQITVSIGGAIHDGHPDYEQTLKAADKALYQAKETGRDKYVEHGGY